MKKNFNPLENVFSRLLDLISTGLNFVLTRLDFVSMGLYFGSSIYVAARHADGQQVDFGSRCKEVWGL